MTYTVFANVTGEALLLVLIWLYATRTDWYATPAGRSSMLFAVAVTLLGSVSIFRRLGAPEFAEVVAAPAWTITVAAIAWRVAVTWSETKPRQRGQSTSTVYHPHKRGD